MINYRLLLYDRNTLLVQLLCYILNHLTAEAITQLCANNYDLKDCWENHDK